jgi:uncharacterized protein (DUF1015 family)
MRALRFTAGAGQLGALLCPPYDVIDDSARAALLAADPDNAVRVVLPRAGGTIDPVNSDSAAGASPADEVDDDPYTNAARQLDSWLADGVVAIDQEPALYVYEMRVPEHDGEPASITRGLVGAVELRGPQDGVILPHENTMAGPVADRLALMDATDANLEPIYLVYDGGGAASDAVAAVGDDVHAPRESTTGYQSRHGAAAPTEGGPATGAAARSAPNANAPAQLASATTPDGIEHRLWAITDPATLAAIDADLLDRRALIADGHHRYATYRELAAQRTAEHGTGPWNRGLALLVDSSAYGPQVHPIHRVVPGLSFEDAVRAGAAGFTVDHSGSVDEGVARLSAEPSATVAGATASDFTVVITDGTSTAVLSKPDRALLQAAQRAGEPEALMDLDVSVLHRVLIEKVWNLVDDEHHVLYAHDVDEALAKAKSGQGIAILLRATPVDAVSAVAAAGARMPRKSTFFTPKPASGLVMRRFVDQLGLTD